VGDVVADLAGKIYGREEAWGTEPGALEGARAFVAAARAADFLPGLAQEEGSRPCLLYTSPSPRDS